MRGGVDWTFDMSVRIRCIPFTSSSPLVNSCWSVRDDRSGERGEKGICDSAISDATIKSRLSPVTSMSRNFASSFADPGR